MRNILAYNKKLYTVISVYKGSEIAIIISSSRFLKNNQIKIFDLIVLIAHML